jgi:hypothetical protein
MHLLFFLPQEQQIRIERWLRRREDFRQLALADCVIVSFDALVTDRLLPVRGRAGPPAGMRRRPEAECRDTERTS